MCFTFCSLYTECIYNTYVKIVKTNLFPSLTIFGSYKNNFDRNRSRSVVYSLSFDVNTTVHHRKCCQTCIASTDEKK